VKSKTKYRIRESTSHQMCFLLSRKKSKMKSYSELELIIKPNRKFFDEYQHLPDGKWQVAFENNVLKKPANLWNYTDVVFTPLKGVQK
jgi:hypothetical protein